MIIRKNDRWEEWTDGYTSYKGTHMAGTFGGPRTSAPVFVRVVSDEEMAAFELGF